MKLYKIKRTQILHSTLDVAWGFFSSPANLRLLTPAYMNFRILSSSGDDRLYAGQMIHYKVSILPGLPVDWLTEITHAHEPYYFVDEQRNGPFRIWQHQHKFREVEGRVEMTDEVNYAVPFSFIGRLTNHVFVEKTVNAIFDYRFKALEDIFKDDKTKIRKSA